MMLGGTEQAVAVCNDCINLGSGCGLELNRQAAWRPECNRIGVILFGGIELAVAVNCDCKELGLWLRGLNSVVRAVAMLVGGTLLAVVVISDCKDFELW